jgi:hypothetical protein
MPGWTSCVEVNVILDYANFQTVRRSRILLAPKPWGMQWRLVRNSFSFSNTLDSVGRDPFESEMHNPLSDTTLLGDVRHRHDFPPSLPITPEVLRAPTNAHSLGDAPQQQSYCQTPPPRTLDNFCGRRRRRTKSRSFTRRLSR